MVLSPWLTLNRKTIILFGEIGKIRYAYFLKAFFFRKANYGIHFFRIRTQKNEKERVKIEP